MQFDSKGVRKRTAKLAATLSKKIGDRNVIDDADLLDGVAEDKSHCSPSRPNLLVRARSRDHVVACLEEVAYNMGFIRTAEVRNAAERLKGNAYGQYLLRLLDEEEEEKRAGRA